MTSLGFNTGLRALLSSRFVLDTIGHNIANANTRGYSRQIVQLNSSFAVQRQGVLIGTGVDTQGVQRQIDELLGRRILNQVSVAGGLQSRLGGLSEIEALLGEPGDGGLGSLLDGFFSRISELSTAPDDGILRTGVIQSAVGLTGRFREVSSGLDRIVRDTEAELRTRVSSANRLAEEIAALNVQIGQVLATGTFPNDLADQRDRAVEELAELVDVTATPGKNGAVQVTVGGTTLVSSSRSFAMSVDRAPDESLAIRIQGANGAIPVSGGAIGGLLETFGRIGPELSERMDRLAHNLILELNRVHSTGIPSSGPFETLTASNRIEDRDEDGQLTDELLSKAGLPFDVTSGVLHVNVSDLESGATTRHAIAISSTHTTVGDLLDELNAIDGLSADLDGFGRLRIEASPGRGFDFSARLDPRPDAAGTFGGARASLGTAAAEPFALADGDTLTLTVDPAGAAVPVSIAFAQADFFEISEATADEIAAAINASPDAQSAGLVATSVEGRLFLQSAATGAAQEFRVDGGTALGALGWTGFAGTTIAGSANAVDVRIGGSYTGDADDVLTFRPNMDGTIGTTPGLEIEVFDAAGRRVATLDVGPGYEPGTELGVGQGVTVAFGLGDVSAAQNDLFSLDVVADSDTADVLVALGLNSLLTGTDASDVAVRSDVELDPSLFASSASGAASDGALLLRLLDVESLRAEGLDGGSVGEFYGEIVEGVGFGVSSTTGAIDANDSLLSTLQSRRDQVSGVSIDEEIASMLQYEQAFSAAAQYITVVNQLNEEVLGLV